MPILGITASQGLAPGAPTIGTATAVTATSATVAYTAPTWTGKGTGTVTYTATSSPGGLTGTATSSPITVSGLTTGTAYTFTVKATTSYGVTGPSSAASNSVTPAVVNVTDYQAIATITIPVSTTGTISFTSITSAYKHLQIRGVLKSGRTAATFDNIQLRINNDTTSNYNSHNSYGFKSGSPASQSAGTQTYSYISYSGASGQPNYYSTLILDFADYTSTSKTKTGKYITGVDDNEYGVTVYGSTLWLGTAAINRIDIFTEISALTQYSSLALYGIKG
jgi:hypothetical protein